MLAALSMMKSLNACSDWTRAVRVSATRSCMISRPARTLLTLDSSWARIYISAMVFANCAALSGELALAEMVMR
ncbi:hypothetical protein D3C87_1413380 [compost metagenome]